MVNENDKINEQKSGFAITLPQKNSVALSSFHRLWRNSHVQEILDSDALSSRSSWIPFKSGRTNLTPPAAISLLTSGTYQAVVGTIQPASLRKAKKESLI